MGSKVYTTVQGDAWDSIAYKVYGSEAHTGWLMQNNAPHLDTFVFGAGVVLNTPDPPEGYISIDAPVWRALT